MDFQLYMSGYILEYLDKREFHYTYESTRSKAAWLQRQELYCSVRNVQELNRG